MRHLHITLICILTGCHVQPAIEPAGSAEPSSLPWTWSDWSSALLRGVMPAELPPIPESGWSFNGASWVRSGGEVADRNGDGRVDYIRIVDPPNSYNHRVWVDLDYDGFIDRDDGPDQAGRPDPQYKVPLFELANKPMQRTDSAGR